MNRVFKRYVEMHYCRRFKSNWMIQTIQNDARKRQLIENDFFKELLKCRIIKKRFLSSSKPKIDFHIILFLWQQRSILSLLLKKIAIISRTVFLEDLISRIILILGLSCLLQMIYKYKRFVVDKFKIKKIQSSFVKLVNGMRSKL